jgi:hyperosmotically inducible protein
MEAKDMRIAQWVLLLGGMAAFMGAPVASAQQQESAAMRSAQGDALVKREVRHELVMLSWYSIFDNLAYSVNGGHVTLLGQVTNPTLKSDAQNAVKRIEGVESVDDQIEVLPPSPGDDQIRWAEFRAIYGQPSMQRYAEGAVPSIHIIVKNGHVTLEGVVSSEADKNVANVTANGVPNVFSVTNNLSVASGK